VVRSLTRSRVAALGPPQLRLPPGEHVFWRERRAPPILLLTLVPAGIALLAAISVADPLGSTLLVVGALALALVGVRLSRRVWIEDYAITDARVLVVPRDGPERSLGRDDVAAVAVRGSRVTFHAHDGGGLSFAYVRGAHRLTKRMSALLPGVPTTVDFDALCHT
jgi:hypothetical protein